MRWIVCAWLVSLFLGISKESCAQTVKITQTEWRLDLLFDEVEAQTGMLTLFSNDELNVYQTVTLEMRDYTLEELYTYLLRDTKLTFAMMDGYVVIRLKSGDERIDVRRVVGKISDEAGFPLPGVTIIIKGTSRGTSTDRDGRYELLLPGNAGIVLHFSFVGKRDVEVEYVEGDTLNVVLFDLKQRMDEVVVTGYQQISRRRLTSAVTTLQGDELRVPGQETVDQMLEGKVPGMIFMLNSGQIGVAPRLRIRGTSTVLGNQEPLWVIDGIVQNDPVNIDPELINDLDYVNLLGNAISGLNPDDIAQVDILKDASATALYGIRAANGVIVVTTKKGNVGKLKTNYHFTGSLVFRPRYTEKAVNMMNAVERIDYSREMVEKGIVLPEMSSWVGYEGALRSYWTGDISFQEFQRQVDYLETNNTDWFDILCRDAFSHHHHLSFSGGTPRGQYYVSLGYNRETGILKKEHGDRYTARVNLSGQWGGVGYAVGITGNVQKRNYTPSDVDLQAYAYNTSRAIPATNADGSLWYYPRQGETYKVNFNVLNERDNSRHKVWGRGCALSLHLDGYLGKALKAGFVVAYSFNRMEEREFFLENTAYSRDLRGELYNGNQARGVIPFGGELRESDLDNRSYTLRGQLTYNAYMGALRVHALTAFVGGEINSSKYEGWEQIFRGGLSENGELIELIDRESNEDYRRWWMATPEAQGVAKHQVTNMVSIYGSLSYSWRDLYILNANMRVDASNKFGKVANRKMLPIWSVSGRWDIKNTLFHYWTPLTDCALRASFGYQGNMLDSETTELVLLQGQWNERMEYDESYIYKFPNPNLAWEKTASLNVGMDMAFFADRIKGTFSYFFKRTRNAFLQKEISVINGVGEYVVNQGVIENQGWELGLSCYLLSSRDGDLAWRIDPQMSQVLNVMTDRDGGVGDRSQVLHHSYDYQDYVDGSVQVVGRPLNSFYSYQFVGLDSRDGRPTFANVGEEMWEVYAGMTKDEVFQSVMGFSGCRVPRVQGGVGNTFIWNNFTLNCHVTFSLGAKIRLMELYPDESRVMPHPTENLRRELLERWRRPGDEAKTDIPGILSNAALKETIQNPWWGSEAYRFAENIWQMYNDSDIRVANGNYLKLQRLTLGYNVPKRWCENAGISACALSLSASNLAVWCHSSLRGQDLTTQTGFSSETHVPQRPSLVFSLSVSF